MEIEDVDIVNNEFNDSQIINNENRKISAKLMNLLKEANGEPIIFLLSIAYGVFLSVNPMLLFWTRCVEIFKNETNVTDFCAEITLQNKTESLNQIELDISTMSIYIQICSTITTFISAPIIGAWSDLHGRKKAQIFCIIALIIYNVIQIVGLCVYKITNIYFFMFGAESLLGIMGGLAMASIIANAIIVDDCRNELKKKNTGVPLRIAISCILRTLGNILGSLVYTFSAVPLDKSSQKHANGFIQSYIIGSISCIFALIYTIFFVRETYKFTETNIVEVKKNFIQNVKEYLLLTFKVIYAPRDKWTRVCLWLVLGFMFVDFLNLDNNLQLMLYKRHPFEWSDEKFNLFIVLRFVVTSLGTFFMPFIIEFTNFVGKDSILLMIAFLANSANLLIISVVQSSLIVFIALTLFFFGSCTLSAFPTILSKMVAKEETARLFSVISLLFVLCPLISKSIFYKLYELTFSIYPRVVFLTMSFVILLTFFGQILVHYLMYPIWTNIEDEIYEENNNEINPNLINFNNEDQEPLITI